MDGFSRVDRPKNTTSFQRFCPIEVLSDMRRVHYIEHFFFFFSLQKQLTLQSIYRQTLEPLGKVMPEC